jgi:glycosyltransferase involved in cell wall biosynthesis
MLRLFWFSQTIGKNRGLEILIEALKKINDPSIELTLAGRCNEDMLMYIHEHSDNIKQRVHLAGIIAPENLPAFAAAFDVGLALETGFSTNNDIALSNKIFTYLLAGNAVILSKTYMQQAFNEQYHIGESFALNDVDELAQKICLYKNREILETQRAYNYELAKKRMNWDIESKELTTIII